MPHVWLVSTFLFPPPPSSSFLTHKELFFTPPTSKKEIKDKEESNQMSRSYDPLRHELLQRVKQKEGWIGLAQSVEGVASLLSAMAESDDDTWADRLPFTEEEKERFRGVFAPYLADIRQYVRPTPKAQPSQQGGQQEQQAPQESQESQESQKDSLAQFMPALDLDAAFTGMVQKTEQLNRFAESMASQYGLTRLERDFDTKEDFQVVPQFLTNMLASLGPTGLAAKQFLDKLKVPYRFLVFLVFLYLDIARLTAATMGRTSHQKTLTVILSLLELFRGDWKKAVLTFMGFYGTTPLLAGQQAKILLYLFERLSPTLQERMIYGSWDASKSLLVGVLLSVFQLTAPLSVRKPFMEMLEKLSAAKRGIDQSLIEAGLEPRSDEFAPTWDDIQRLQAVNDDPTFICSCEYREVLKNIGDSALIRLILQLLRLPVDPEMAHYTCAGREPCQPFQDALRADQTPKAQESLSAQGAQGAPESLSAQGAQGAQAAQEPLNAQGAQGAQEPLSAQGAQGAQGEGGVGARSAPTSLSSQAAQQEGGVGARSASTSLSAQGAQGAQGEGGVSLLRSDNVDLRPTVGARSASTALSAQGAQAAAEVPEAPQAAEAASTIGGRIKRRHRRPRVHE